MRSLKLKKQLLTIPGTSPLVFKDEQLLRAFFPKDTVQYAKSWLYTLRFARFAPEGLGFKFINKNLVAIIGFRNEYLYITPILDLTHGRELYELCEKIYALTGYDILLRKIEKTSYTLLPDENEKIHPMLLEDDMFPERMLQLPKLFLDEHTINPAALNLIRMTERFEKNAAFSLIRIKPLKKEYKEKIYAFLKKNNIKRVAYMSLVDYLFSQKDISAYRTMVFLEKDQVCGLYIAEILEFGQIGLYCALSSQDYIGLTEWMDVQFFTSLFREGFKTVLLGGSENEGIYKYVKKLLPYGTRYVTKTVSFQSMQKQVSPHVVVRHAEREDFPQLIQAYKKAYNTIPELDEKWTDETTREFLSHYYAKQEDLFFVVEHDQGEIIGGVFANLTPWWDGYHLSDFEIFLDPAWQGKKIGGKLMLELVRYARKKYNIVSWDTFSHTVHNHPLGWLQRLGFRPHPAWIILQADIDTVLERVRKYE